MKKIHTLIVLSSILFVSEAYAGEIYLAPSVTMSGTSIQYNKEQDTASAQPDKVNKTNPGLSADLGYRGYFGNFFIGPELFANYYGLTVKDFQDSNNQTLSDKDSIKLNYTYGAAINLGYKFTQNFAVFGRFGWGKASSELTWYNKGNTAVDPKQSCTDNVALTSIGMWYDLTENYALRASYDYQEYIIRDHSGALFQYMSNNPASFDVVIQSLNLGVILKF